MSQENLERAHRAYEALQRRDFDALLTYVDPDVEWHPLVLGDLVVLHALEPVGLRE